jgi:hypothetical protein
LLNLVTSAGLRGVFRPLQIAPASSVWALPLKTTILLIKGLPPKTVAGMVTDYDFPL